MGINRLDHATIRVDDLAGAERFYTESLGLRAIDRTNGTLQLGCGESHADLTLTAGGKGIETLAFGVDEPADLESCASRLGEHGVDIEWIDDPDRPGVGRLIRFQLPVGVTMEFQVAADGRRAGATMFDAAWDGSSPTPLDIDHVNLLGDDVHGLATFVEQALGFVVSDAMEAGDEWAAMWARSGELHHDLACVKAPSPEMRLHHVAFLLADSRHFQVVADSVIAHGGRLEFGPGRHGGGGSNLFMYLFDPAGNRVELSADMSRIPAGTPLLFLEGEVPLIMNQWAVNMPESFLVYGT